MYSSTGTRHRAQSTKHPCDLCGLALAPGDVYDTWRCWDGVDACTVRVHPGCYDLALALDCDDADEGWLSPEALTEARDHYAVQAIVDAMALIAPDHLGPVERWWASMTNNDTTETP